MTEKTSLEVQIPEKLYFKIGEVGKLTGLPTYVLRFWEGEFKKLKPQRTPAGQRLYRKKDVEMVLKIKHLLHEKKFTIEGARQRLAKSTRGTSETSTKTTIDTSTQATLSEIRAELIHIRDLLNRPPTE